MKFNFRVALFLGTTLVPLPWASGAESTGDGGDAQRLVALLDYVGGDYARAVQGGVIRSADEYEEQLRFIEDMRVLANRMTAADEEKRALARRVAEIDRLVRSRADANAVANACHAARDEVVERFGVPTVPAERPSLSRAQALYARACAVCHGMTGRSDTEIAGTLNPAPASFKEPGRLRDLSPYRVYNALTFGVPGTAMPSFSALSPEERWDLAFYVFRLGHEGEPAEGPGLLTLPDLAVHSDRELLEMLEREGARPQPALVYGRREAPFIEAPPGVGLERTRRLLDQAWGRFAEGRAADADRLVLDAYLQGFEPLEPRLRARDPKVAASVEVGFRELRAAIARQDATAVEAQIGRLNARLAELRSAGRPVIPFLAAALIYLREGAEAALLVGALLAGLRRMGRPEGARFIHTGWVLALVGGLLTWWVSSRILTFTAARRELVEAVVALLAASVLFVMSFWMISRVEARRWTGYLRRSLEATLTRRNMLLLSGVSFLAVYREAAETVLFTQALMLESVGEGAQVGAGAAVGTLAVIGIALVMRRTVVRLPMRLFFGVSGLLLCVLAVSFAGGGIYELVAGGYLAPRPARFPEIAWLGIYPDWTGLLVQLTILAVIAAAAAMVTLKRHHADSDVDSRS